MDGSNYQAAPQAPLDASLMPVTYPLDAVHSSLFVALLDYYMPSGLILYSLKKNGTINLSKKCPEGSKLGFKSYK